MTEPIEDVDERQRGAPRRTRQRAALAALIGNSEEFKTAQDLHTDLIAAGERVGIATVYRTLQHMVDAGELDVIRTTDGQSAYRSCSPRHHHHLICRICGKTVEVQAPDFETWANAIAHANGFTEIEHELELFGRCADH